MMKIRKSTTNPCNFHVLFLIFIILMTSFQIYVYILNIFLLQVLVYPLLYFLLLSLFFISLLTPDESAYVFNCSLCVVVQIGVTVSCWICNLLFQHIRHQQLHFTAFSVDVAKWMVIVGPEMETTARWSCLFCGTPVPRWGTNSGHL